jgi:hypothetical protein
MKFTEHDIRTFQALWCQEFGKKISAEEAEIEARSLLIFLQIILQ